MYIPVLYLLSVEMLGFALFFNKAAFLEAHLVVNNDTDKWLVNK